MTNRNKCLPLTETTFYVLTALTTPRHGYDIMQTVEQLSGGDVCIAAGTMYGSLENLSKQGLIQAVPSSDPRRKVYQATTLGQEVLDAEKARLRQLLQVSSHLGGLAAHA